MIALRRIAGIVAVLGATSLGITGCQPGATEQTPAATGEQPADDVAHDHDGDGVADHSPDEHDAGMSGQGE